MSTTIPFVSPDHFATKLGRAPSQTARLRMDGLRKFPGLSNWLADPFGMAGLLLGPSDSTGFSPNTVDGGPLGGSANYVRCLDQVALTLAANYPNVRVELDVLDWINYTGGQTPGDPTLAPYQTTRVLSAGSGAPWCQMPGSSGQMLSVAKSGYNALTGSRYFFAVKLDPDASAGGWVPTSTKNIGGLSSAAGSYGAWLYLSTDGKLNLRHSPDGTTLLTRTSTVAVPGTVGTPLWVGVDANLNNSGSQLFQFVTSTDGRNWTPLGTDVTAAGTSTWFNPPGVYWTLGSITNGGSGGANFVGKIYEVQVRRGGRGGPTILPIWPGSWHWGIQGTNTAFYPVQGGPLLRIVNAARPGWGLDEFDDPTLLPAMVPSLPYLGAVVNTGHNDQVYFSGDLTTKWDRLLDRLESRLGETCTIGLLTQNATIRVDGPTGNTLALRNGSKARMGQLAAYAQRRGLSVIDTYSVFTDYVTACAIGARQPVAVQPTDNTTPGDGSLLDLLHFVNDGQAGVHPKDPVVGGNRLQGGAYLQARKIVEELTA